MDTELATEQPVEDGAELAPAEEKHEGFISEDKAQVSINKQHKRFRDEERAHVRTKTEADNLRKELDELKASSVDLTVPPVPDPYSATFAEETQARDEAIERVATHNAAVKNTEQLAEAKDQERVDQGKAKEAEQVAVFDTNMIKLGLNPAETNTAAKTVLENNVSDTLLDVLMEDDEGPLMVHYLANNPVEQDALNGMSALQLVNHINTELKPKASLLKPKTSDAPDPPIILDGGGVHEIEDQLPNNNHYTLE